LHTWRTGEGAREPLQLAGEVNQRDVAVGDGNGVVVQPADIKNLLDLLREAPGALLDPLQRLRLAGVGGSNSPSRSRPVYPMMWCSGVRSSCEMVDTNSDFSSLARRSSSTSRVASQASEAS